MPHDRRPAPSRVLASIAAALVILSLPADHVRSLSYSEFAAGLELAAPGGSVLTEFSPADHLWHRGLFFKWKYLNGTNYWGDAKNGEPAGDIPTSLDFDCRLTRKDSPERGGYSLRVDCRVTALERTVFGRTPPWTNSTGRVGGGYSGLTLRLRDDAKNWRRELGRDRAVLTDPAGGLRLELVDLRPTPISKLYSWPDGRFYNFSPVYFSELTLEKGDALELAYEILITSKGVGK